MKNTIKKLLAVGLLSALAIAPLPAQTNPPVGGVLSGKDLTAIQVAKIKAETDIAQRKLDDDKSIIEKREDARRLMVHDLAWNSCVCLFRLVLKNPHKKMPPTTASTQEFHARS